MLEQEQKLLRFLGSAGDEGALAKATAAAVVVCSSDGNGGLSLSLSVDHCGKHYSLPPHLSGSEDPMSPAALPLQSPEELRRAAAKLVDALSSRAMAAEGRAAAAEAAVAAAQRAMRETSRALRGKVEPAIKKGKPSEMDRQVAQQKIDTAKASGGGGPSSKGGHASSSGDDKARAVVGAEKKLGFALDMAERFRRALVNAASDPRTFDIGGVDLSGAALATAAAANAALGSLPGSATASPAGAAAAKSPSPMQPQNRSHSQQQWRPAPLRTDVGRIIAEATQRVQLFQATQQLQSLPPPRFPPSSLSPPAAGGGETAAVAAAPSQQQQHRQQPRLPPLPRVMEASSSAKFVPPSGAGRVKKRRK